MNLSMLIAIIVFFASVVLSQKIAVNAGLRLDDETRLKIAKVFPKRNANYTVIVFGIVVLYLLGIYMLPEYLRIITITYGLIFFVYIFLKLFLNVKKLRELSAPPEYIRSVVTSFAVFIGGAAAAAIVVAVGNSTF
jgi:hypothetical protein